MLKAAQGDFNQGNVAILEIQQVKDMHGMYYFYFAGQLLETFPFGSHITWIISWLKATKYINFSIKMIFSMLMSCQEG